MIKAKPAVATIAILYLMFSLASAQEYCIRANRGLNLRAAASLQSNVVDTVVSGETLQVTGEYNRWLKISRNGREVWLANWVNYSRLDHCGGTGSGQGTPAGAADVDNCCFVDRQCSSDQQWTDGYWAFQNNECSAPAGSQTPTSSQPVSGAQIDNCCFVDRQCSTDREWTDGYWAFQNNQCPGPAPAGSGAPRSFQVVGRAPRAPEEAVPRAPGESVMWAPGELVLDVGKPDVDLVIEGSAKFIAEVMASLDLLKTRAPQWYDYTVAAFDYIFELPGNIIVRTTPDVSLWIFGSDFPYLGNTVGFAGVLVHEACHLYQQQAGLASGAGMGWKAGLVGERECLTIEIEAFEVFSPGHPDLPGMRHTLANIDNPEYQWWHGCKFAWWHGDESECD